MRSIAALALLLLAGCSASPRVDDPGAVQARLADFAACPWNGTGGTPDGCADEVARLEPSGEPALAGPCLDQIRGGGAFTLRVHRQPQGVAIENAVAVGGRWHAVAVFAADPSVAYAWTLGPESVWLLLPEAPTTGELAVLFLAYNLTTTPATLAQDAEIRWAVESYGVRPILVGSQHYFDVGLFPGAPPFVVVPANLNLTGADFSLRLDGVINRVAKLDLQAVPVNGVDCAMPV